MQHAEGVTSVLHGGGDSDTSSLGQQFLVPVPGDDRRGVRHDVHLQRTAVTDVVRLVVDLLFENRRETCGGGMDQVLYRRYIHGM